jgi:LmbE family N-acetylglucosaminyl deacetylase
VSGPILAVDAHIGDMDLTAGPALAEMALLGHRVVLVALTPGERGHPRMSLEDYRLVKMGEGDRFAEQIGAELQVFDGSDGLLDAESFARGETYGFRYIDYYTALLTMRGCLARTTRACAFATAAPDRTVLQEL